MSKHFSRAPLWCAVALIGGVLAAPVAHAQLSGSVGVVSLYKSNGIDQDVRTPPRHWRPSAQLSLEYDFGNGFYVGNWNGTGKFGNNAGADVEIDLYAGYRGKLTGDVGYDVSLTRFIYPSDGGGGWNSNELGLAFNYGPVTLKLTNLFVENGTDARRLSLAWSHPISDKLTLNAVVGKRNTANNNGAVDLGVGMAYDLGDAWTATATLSGAQTSKVGDAGKTRLVLGVSKGF